MAKTEIFKSFKKLLYEHERLPYKAADQELEYGKGLILPLYAHNISKLASFELLIYMADQGNKICQQ